MYDVGGRHTIKEHAKIGFSLKDKWINIERYGLL